ncbi:serine hydrolase domain-containing protein [Actinomadura rubrisoli]|uniref:Class A beta-lactamase-related serine hydrolase n=1 Tax=Actinomadura rubrisoli TaxID=2530368 RepID=A0A4R5CAL3_9ACTN|nr:serine hydrolase domain-containing protein [Actinomadura rubrisoli]TDD94134.1 class A beta-lactamase-related serine hydrolase [Actinomadura rubrisoli]
MKLSTKAGVAGLASVMLALSSAAPATAAGARAGSTQMGDVQQALNALAKTRGVVGAIGAAYVDGKRVDRGSAGSRLLDGKGGRIPANARYRIASQTKTMTATMLLQLVNEGKLGLEDKLGDLLPELVSKDLVERASEITVRQLIKMTSGIPDYPASERFDGFDFTTRYRPVDLVKMAREMPRTGEPGEKFSYSNTNFILLGMIIEKVTGHALPAEFNRRLFRPLGMTRTYLPTRPPQGIKGPHGHGYAPDAQGRPRDVDRLNASTMLGAGGVVSTARDVSTFFRAFYGGKLLPASLQQLITFPPRGCEGGKPEFTSHGGGAPGLLTSTYTTPDGRSQFALSVTLSIDHNDRSVVSAISQAAKEVVCPKE